MIAAYLDSTNLKPEATISDIRLLCEEAAYYNMTAVCVQPCRVVAARNFLAGSKVKLCTVIGFPLGADTLHTKLTAAQQALEDGAHELDMVINIGLLKDGAYSAVENEIKLMLELKQDYRFILKVIVETALLGREELEKMTIMISTSGADYIKTSTGFSTRGVSLEDIAIIKSCKSDKLRIKASGGVRTLDFAGQLIKAGADRIGSSNAALLAEEFRQRGGLLKG